MIIASSMDWDQHRQILKDKIQSLPYNRDLRTLLKNIDVMVDDLSKAEVFARRHRRIVTSLPEVQQVNTAINTLEQWIMMAVLLK